MKQRVGWVVLFLLIISIGQTCRGERILAADTYLDKLEGMWIGQIMGNYAGRPYEGSTARGGLSVTVDWNFVSTTEPWSGDDDTCFEYMYLDALKGNVDPDNQAIRQTWESHVPLNSFFIANRQARYQMAKGLTPPETGGIHHNAHWYAIDAQITSESVGAATPGLRQRAADLTGRFGAVTNDGHAVHAAQFYGAMYASAIVESDVETVVAKALEVVPTTSRSYQIIQDVRDIYNTDKADGQLDWRAAQRAIYDQCCGADSHGRYYNWIESTVNLGMTTLAVLYGQGDYRQTVEIGVLAGFDCDCNPATAGGVVGLMRGFSGLPTDLTGPATDNYYAQSLTNITRESTISQIALDWREVGEAQILAAGGRIEGEGAGRTYYLPDDDAVVAPLEKPDPQGPKGLVGEVLALGGEVTVSASIDKHQASNDRNHLEGIIDGITDVTYNGHRPYWTNDGINDQPSGGDFYQLNFDREVLFTSLIFHEGDYVWTNINGNLDNEIGLGGYFCDLTVEVGRDGVFTEVSGLAFSEALDRLKFYQQIGLTFDPVSGDAIRIRGTAGGTSQFTTIVELEAFGVVPEPATGAMLALAAFGALRRRRSPR